jgi:hypothetical protein
MRLTLKKCSFCSKEFQPTISTQKFCSIECYHKKINNEKIEKETSHNAICNYCGKSFYLQKKRLPKENENRYCSIECRGKQKTLISIKKIEGKLNIDDLGKYLNILYTERLKSTREIAEILYSNRKNYSSISRLLNYYNIPIRTGSEAVKTQYLGKKGIGRKSISTKNAKTYLNIKESREKLKRVMQTKEYKMKQRITKLGEKNGMYGVTGESHPQWNPNRTHEQRILERKTFEYKQWRKAIYERDKYTCQYCGDKIGGSLNAHHLDGYSWCNEKRYDVNNGITLCEECHKDFHHQYGNRNNTKEQFNKWILSKSARGTA